MPQRSRRPVGSKKAAALLAARIADRSAKIGVIGLGYVGLPLVCLFSEQGFQTTGFDIDPKKIAHSTPAAAAARRAGLSTAPRS